MDTKYLDVMIKDVQADSKWMRLLHILGQQLELLINEGRPDLASLFASLQTETLVSEQEYGELRATFALEAVSPSLRRERSRTDLEISAIGGDATGLFEYRR